MIIKIKADMIGIKKPISILPSLFLQTQANKMARFLNKLSIEAIQAQIKDLNDNEETTESDEKDKNDKDKLTESLKSAKESDKALEQEENAVGKCLEFLQDALGLTDKQMETAQRNIPDSEKLAIFVSYVIGKIKGKADDEMLKIADKEPEKDPKKD
jgi:hypothetical protein